MTGDREHLGDDAELYPLGVLDDDAARTVERHIAGCDACAGRVAEAQLTAAALASALPAPAPPASLARRLRESAAPERPAARTRRRDIRAFALAAALLLALAGLGVQSVNLQRRDARESLALATLVRSHFRHVPMDSREPAPFAAKVLYAPDGSWIYVIADGARGSLRVVGRYASGTAELGDLEGPVQKTLLARPGRRLESVELRSGDQVVARAALVY